MAAVAVGILVVASVPAVAADKYWSGSGIWDTTPNAWGSASGVYGDATWGNAAPDSAVFEGAGGTVTLGEAITAANMTFSSDNYTIELDANTLTVASGGAIIANGTNVTILSDVTRSGTIHLGGTGSGSVGNLLPNSRIGFEKDGTGTWTINGQVQASHHNINAGILIVNGTLYNEYRQIYLDPGAVLHCNSPGSLRPRNDYNNAWQIAGGAFVDNSSGAAITTSTYNPAQRWNGNWTFIGSDGANSDLYLGTGTVWLNGDRTVTVSNALTTLTVGGVIDDRASVYGLTKAGAGTLELTGANTYEGDTTVEEGVLSITQPSLPAGGNVYVTNSGVLNLDFVGTNTINIFYTNGVTATGGIWGPDGSDAPHTSENLTGTGRLNVLYGMQLDGVRYWDGGTADIGGKGDGTGSGGGGTWSSSIKNWDQGAGVDQTGWNNATNDMAVFKGTSGTVSLDEDINLGALYVDSVNGYVIESNTLNFATGGAITNSGSLTIRSSITGSPKVVPQAGLTLAPTAGTMTIGAVPSGHVRLDGTTTGNTVASIGYDASKYGSGTWTVLGDLSFRLMTVDEGTLIVEGACSTGYRFVDLKGGTLVINGSLYHGHSGHPFRFSSGTLSGTGWIENGGDQALTVPAAGTIAPGYPTGTLTVTNISCTINGNLDITIDGAQNSTLAVDGNLNVTNAALNVTEDSLPSGAVIIATYTTLNQPFKTITGADRFEIVYEYEGSNAIALVPPPSGSVLIVR